VQILGRSLLSLALVAAAVNTAEAYNCTPVTDGEGRPASPAVSQVWNQRCVPYAIQRGNDLFSGEVRRQLLAQSFAVWANNACTDLTFTDLGYTSQGVGFDPGQPNNQNVITSIESQAEIPNYFSDPNMVAITVTAFSTVSGEIFDADIAVNGVNFDFADVTDENACNADSNPPFDLRSILIHEMGHFIGFDHAPELDSTMYFSAPVCETQKRTLSIDDINGLCTVYATGQPPMTCAPPLATYDSVAGATSFRDQCGSQLASGDGGCSCSAQPTSNSAWMTLSLFAGLLLVRRRR
jgi:MYXO-CTERM domain-containing protein